MTTVCGDRPRHSRGKDAVDGARVETSKCIRVVIAIDGKPILNLTDRSRNNLCSGLATFHHNIESRLQRETIIKRETGS